MSGRGTGNIYFEITVIGSTARVAAIDERTNTEVQVVCPANYSRISMEQAALRKLRYVLEKKGLAPAK